MRNDVQSLASDVAAAAAAIANARGGRRGALEIANILDILPKKLFDEVVEDAEAAIQAAAAAVDGAPPPPRTHGPLNAADASALGKSLDAGTLVILARDRASRPSAAMWAAGVSASTLPEAEAQRLWTAFTTVSRKLAETQP